MPAVPAVLAVLAVEGRDFKARWASHARRMHVSMNKPKDPAAIAKYIGVLSA